MGRRTRSLLAVAGFLTALVLTPALTGCGGGASEKPAAGGSYYEGNDWVPKSKRGVAPGAAGSAGGAKAPGGP